jgi:hypothetical protein
MDRRRRCGAWHDVRACYGVHAYGGVHAFDFVRACDDVRACGLKQSSSTAAYAESSSFRGILPLGAI